VYIDDKEWYARWMYEGSRPPRATKIGCPPPSGVFEWIAPFLRVMASLSAIPHRPEVERDPAAAEAAMVRINQLLIRHSNQFFSYRRPTDFRLGKNAIPSSFPPMSARKR